MWIRKWTLVIAAVALLTAAGVGAVLAAPLAQEADGGSEEEAEESSRPYLGIAVAPLNPRAHEELDIPEDVEGVVVRGVEDEGPGHDAGLQRGDVITAADGTDIATVEAFRDIVQASQPGDVLVLTILREGESRDASVTVGEAPTRPHRPQVQPERRSRPDVRPERPVRPELRPHDRPNAQPVRPIRPELRPHDRPNVRPDVRPERDDLPRWLRQLYRLVNTYPHLVDSELRLLNDDGEVVTYNVTMGTVVGVSGDTVGVEKRAGGAERFTLTEESVVIKAFHRVELERLEEGDHVAVLEKDGEVMAVVAGPFKHPRPAPDDPRPDSVLEQLKRLWNASQEADEALQKQLNAIKRQMERIEDRLERLEQS